jgi:hypothetical protein
MTESRTQRATYVFAVKEFADGTPWIMFEKVGGGLDIFDKGFLGFDLEQGTSLGEAEALSKLLCQRVTSISFTSFDK